MTIHKEGHGYCVVATAIYAALIWLCNAFLPGFVAWPLIILAGLLWFWVFWFFRIPDRSFTQGEKFLVSPCDGKVVVIEETQEDEYFRDKRIQVSIFMSPLNVHVNRYPMKGVVDYAVHHAGKYLVAWHPKSSTENERTTIVIRNDRAAILVRQIAGAVARRIVMYAQKGHQAEQNAELGFIKFGSRVDLFLPPGTTINAKIGDVVKGGVDVIATLA